MKVTNVVFERRGIDAAQLPPASGDLLPIDEAAEAQREAAIAQNFGAVSPGLIQFTTDVLFRNLWLRPGFTPRDRNLVTVSTVVGTGQVHFESNLFRMPARKPYCEKTAGSATLAAENAFLRDLHRSQPPQWASPQ